jgi:hypothetical protein
MPHHLRGNGKEMGSIPPIYIAMGQQPDERLLHERRGLHAMVLPLAPQVAPGNPA